MTVDVLIPTYKRPAALAVTLTSLAAQEFKDFRVVISDQTDDDSRPLETGEVQTVIRLLQSYGHAVETHRHLPPRGMAEQRQFLLDQTRSPYALYLDNDLILEPHVVRRMLRAIQEENCGFVGCAVVGLNYLSDERPAEQNIEFWDGRVQPETILPATPEWERYVLHNAANIVHAARKHDLTVENTRKYKVAWVGGCVMYDAAKLREAGGFEFWRDIPVEHCSEDVLAQMRLMQKHGGCGLIPSGVYHQDLTTTIEERRFDAAQILRFGKQETKPRVSVLMPTRNQARFVARAIDSLLAGTFREWELVVFNDGSTDNTESIIAPYLADARVRYYHSKQNRGLGRALNECLGRAQAELVAYLPSDDVYHRNHLAALVEKLEGSERASLAFSGVRHHYNKTAAGRIEDYSLQLVQVLHRRTEDKWIEREELVTDDLGRMFFDQLKDTGEFVPTNEVTCEWVDHPEQLHKIVREPVGGINLYRRKFDVQHPLRFHTTVGNKIDEVARYARFRERPDTPFAANGLKVLLVGELAYNADRVLALEERGHKLYGLWIDEPYWYNTVGKLPFGHCEDLPGDGWREAIAEIKPDIIYSLLNWQAVPFAHRVLTANTGVPFVWHYKEGPFISLEKGHWSQLVDLQTLSDGQIYSSPEMRDWQMTITPSAVKNKPSLILDGDLPKHDWFAGIERSPLLSGQDGEIHTVVPGRPIGLHPETVAELAAQSIHLHFYGDFTHGQWLKWIERTKGLAGRFIHLHANVDQENWVREFSQYDAGWLHFFTSENAGDIRRANWDDLNYPARIATLMVSGLPMLQGDNTGSIVAAQTLARQMEVGLLFKDMRELGAQLRDKARIASLRESVWRQRELFTFDRHADRLIEFFRQVIARR